MKNQKHQEISIETRTIDQFNGVRSPAEIRSVISSRLLSGKWIKSTRKRKDVTEVYYTLNLPLAFDIETTSFMADGEKRATMYGWTLGLNGEVILGRTWAEFVGCIDALIEMLELREDRRIVIYVHNLGYDFQFFHKWLDFTQVFALSERKPVYARTSSGVEFRCSYILTDYSLAELSNKLLKYKVEKMVGDLDYDMIRHSGTPLTEKEIKYMENDVRVIMAYIQEQIEKERNITHIPLTKTGYVRRYCRNACLYEARSHKHTHQYNKYRQIMKNLTLDPEEYEQLKRAFAGGFTHANAFKANRTQYDVASMDFTSSYPAVMIAEEFPMGKAEIVNIQNRAHLEYNLIRYCCIFDIKFEEIESDTCIDHPISVSKCWDREGVMIDNGRVIRADRICTTITGEDFKIIDRFYKWKRMSIGTFRRYPKAYLPTEFVKSILELYKQKTELKGVHGREGDYINAKERVNACYGMTVTDIVRDEITYDGGQWGHKSPSLEEMIERTNTDRRRFLFYPWGVWVTAYARRNLFEGIYAIGDDYIYADTDSIKLTNYRKHKSYFKEYDVRITEKLRAALDYHGLDYSYIAPKTIEGIEKPLGVWDFEGMYSRFKTLGAKRYITENDNGISITVSGVNKKNAVPYLLKKYKPDRIFDAFEDGLVIPPGHAGKSTHTYIDEEFAGELTDYTGVTAEYEERSAIHLEPCGYDMSLTSAYLDYLMGIEEYNK